jgi:outer membrane protein assembly factor BamB
VPSIGNVEGPVDERERAALIATPSGTVLAFPANGTSCSPGANGLVALRISAGSPPSVATAWCASVSGKGSPIATTTGGGLESMIWIAGAPIGVAEGDNRLHGVNAETGEPIFTSAKLGAIARWNAPIVAKGRIYIAGVGAAYAFTVR